MPLYDEALAFLQARGAGGAGGAALAGGAARAAAALATAPLELARTRAQAPGGGLPPLPRVVAGGGITALARVAWTGGAATLARDVPFSALYWGLLEPARSAVLTAWGDTDHAAVAVAGANLVGGAAAGAAAAAATTPLDVVKTKLQLEAGSGPPGVRTPGVWATLRSVAEARGVRGLFSGVGPRSARAAPACAIVVAAYELLKIVVGGDVSGSESIAGGLLEES